MELAIPNLTEQELAAAEAVMQKVDTEPDSKRWGELNWQFHEVLYRAAGRPKLLSMIQHLHNNVERYMRIYLSTLHHQEKSQAEHRLQLAACAEKDVKKAQKLLRKHMNDAQKNLGKYLRQ